jgi:hypothetical protein
VLSRTAIHAPGGWALIENLPHVLSGDRATVGFSTTVIPSPEDKNIRFSLREAFRSVWDAAALRHDWLRSRQQVESNFGFAQ